MRSQRPVALTAVVIAALASWTWSRRVPNEQAMIEAEVANGWTLRNDAVPSTLAEAERSAFALVPDATYLKPDVPPEEWYADWRGVVPGGAAWDAGGHVRSPWAVWTTRALLSAKECAAMSKASRGLGLLGPPEALFSAFDNVSQAYITHRLYLFSFGQPWTISRLGRAATPYLALLPDKRCAAWVARAEELQLETGDFVFAGGSWGLSRIHTGARRHSATRVVMDEGFAALMKTRLDGQVCSADYPRSPEFTECMQYSLMQYTILYRLLLSTHDIRRTHTDQS